MKVISSFVSRRRSEKFLKTGFTIVELIVVIVVIAILATVTIVAYNGVSKRAAQSSLKIDLAQITKQLLNDKTTSGSFPATLAAANNGNGIKAGASEKLEYTSDGTTFCVTISSSQAQTSYFANESGALQDGVCAGHTGYQSTPTIAMTNVAAGNSHSCVLAGGLPYCWGQGGVGQLGNNSTANSYSLVPVIVSGALNGKTITDMSAGIYHTCVLASGAPYCWGYNYSGQLGNSSWSTALTPSAVTTSGVLSGKTLTMIAAGGYHSCTATSTQVFCWGTNGNGQLGNNSMSDSNTPVATVMSGVLSGKTIAAISAGQYHTCALASGQVYCWGSNGTGQLGNNSTTDSSVPVAVDTSGVLSGKTVTAIAAGNSHTCAVASGQVYCWGYNYYGQLGNNTNTTSLVPVAVDTSGVLSGKTVTAITSGASHSCAIASNAAYCWGLDGDGQLGDNYNVYRYTPVAVDTSGVLTGKTVSALASGQYGTCAIASNQLYCWGINASAIGSDSLVPVAFQLP